MQDCFGCFGYSASLPWGRDNAMELTGRQKEFLREFLDLYREAGQALHYTAVAERLGVGKITAYDMLRLLEEKGLVTSEYALPPSRSAGRSSIVFRPTSKAHELMAHLAGDAWERAEWQEVKERILEALRAGKGRDYEPLLKEILSRLDKQSSPLFAAAEMLTAIILTLDQLRREAETSGLAEWLRALGFPGEVGLSALAGLTVGLSLAEQANRSFTARLPAQVWRFQESLARLSAESKRHLSEFASEAWKIVEA